MYGAYLTKNCSFLIDELRKNGLEISWFNIFLWAVVMPFILPLASLHGIILLIYSKVTGK
jgi:hypothetical protein